MFQNQNLSRCLPIVFPDKKIQNKYSYHCRRSSQGKHSFDLAQVLELSQKDQKHRVKGTYNKRFSFQEGFKRKYYSVCSQVIKIKKQWYDIKLRNLAYFSKQKKSGTNLFKRFYPTVPIKAKSKYQTSKIKKTLQVKADQRIQNNIKKPILSKKIILFKKSAKNANKQVIVCTKKMRNTVSHLQSIQQTMNEIKELKPWPWQNYEQSQKMISIQ